MKYEIPERMKAMVLFGPNDMRLVQDKPVPRPGPGEVLVKVAACGICGSDVKILRTGMAHMPPYGSFTPGHEWAGTVVALGESVDEFEIGDRIAVQAHHGCGRCRNCLAGHYTNCLNYANLAKGHLAAGMTSDGGFAEYAVHHVSNLYKLPDNIDFVSATYVTTLGTSLWATDCAGGYIAGDTVLIAGPGPIGLSMVHVCKALKAARIILTGTREDRLRVGREIGADYTINICECPDPLKEIMRITDGKGCEWTYDCAGNSESVNLCLHATMPAHVCGLIALYKEVPKVDLDFAVFNGITLTTSRGEGGDNCRRAVSLMASGEIDARKVMTHQFPLEKWNEAMDWFINRRDGALKVVVTME